MRHDGVIKFSCRSEVIRTLTLLNSFVMDVTARLIVQLLFDLSFFLTGVKNVAGRLSEYKTTKHHPVEDLLQVERLYYMCAVP